jgi:predicted nucleic acid-binding protein
MEFLSQNQLSSQFISVISLAEIRFGIMRLPEGERRTVLEIWLIDRVRPMFDERVLEVTEDVLVRWRWMVENGRKSGRTYAEPDLLIAATAIEHDLTLVTRNTKDFAGLDLPFFNPWEA